MTHNIEADFAGSELARIFAGDPTLCFDAATAPSTLSTHASYEPASSPWPKADGMLVLVDQDAAEHTIALEYKRPNEGVHGLLTAMGQAYSYLHKGYNGSAIVIPREYATHSSPAEYLRLALDHIVGSSPIGVFHYDEPDTSSPTPFAGRLHCVRPMKLGPTVPGHKLPAVSKTQWVHVREGSTTRDAFFRFLQVSKQLTAGINLPDPTIPPPLVAAIARIAPGKDPAAYLANTADSRLISQTWTHFWFQWVATPEVLTPWIKTNGVYEPPGAFNKIHKDDESGYSQIFEGRANGLKETLCQLLNSGSITENEAWEYFASGIDIPGQQSKQGIRARAHSYREDLDSSLAQLLWIGPDGTPTDYGYKYASLCERYGSASAPIVKDYVGATLIQTGRYGAFLHYIQKLSDDVFSRSPLEYTRENSTGRPIFNEESYREYLEALEDVLANDLRVMRKVSTRARARRRTVFQAELTILRNYGFVSKSRHRLGVGIPIDWESVMKASNVEL